MNNGRKCFITNASVADFFVVTAMTAKDQGTKGISAFLVYKGTPGLSVGNHENKMGIRAITVIRENKSPSVRKSI